MEDFAGVTHDDVSYPCVAASGYDDYVSSAAAVNTPYVEPVVQAQPQPVQVQKQEPVADRLVVAENVVTGDSVGGAVAGKNDPVPQAEPVVVPAAATVPEETPISPVTALTEEELENIPAFIRRRMKIEAETLPAGSKVSRETLKHDPSGTPKGGGHLFD